VTAHNNNNNNNNNKDAEFRKRVICYLLSPDVGFSELSQFRTAANAN
jgi:hypothetical protein